MAKIFAIKEIMNTILYISIFQPKRVKFNLEKDTAIMPEQILPANTMPFVMLVKAENASVFPDEGTNSIKVVNDVRKTPDVTNIPIDA